MAIEPDLAPAAATPAAAPPAPEREFAPVIDVGSSAPSSVPGEPGSNLIEIFRGAGSHPMVAPGDGKVQSDFLAGRALAQNTDPWSKLEAVMGGARPSQGAPTRTGGTTPAPGTGEDQQGTGLAGMVGSLLPNDDRPIGRKLTDAARAVQSASETDDEEGEAGSGLDLSSIIPPIGRAARDIGIGGIETPQAILRGMLGGVEGLARTTMSVGDAIDSVLPDWLGKNFPGRENIAAGVKDIADYAAEDKAQIPEPTTTTGGLVEGVAQFGTGLTAGNKVAALAGVTGAAGHVLANLVAGATSMDPNAPRLSNLINDVAPNFVTDWLKAKPGEDGPVMGRLKSGLEFAGLGTLFEGLKTGLGVIKQAAAPEGFGPESKLGTPNQIGTTESWATGNPPRAGQMPEGLEGPKPPLVEINPKIAGMAQTILESQQGMERAVPGEAGAPASLSPEQVADYVAGRNADNPIRLNLLRIGSGDDIRAALEQVARSISEPEVQTNEATIRAADASGLSPSDFLAGYRGTNLNASETTAMRFMLDSSADQIIKYARAASDPLSNSDEARVTFLKAFATHRALQQYFVNARAEAGRTLQAWSIMSQTRPGYAQAVEKLIEQAGESNVDQMAANIASLSDPLKVSRLIAASDQGTMRDTFLKTFYNVLLSNPRTVVKKLASDAVMVMWNLATNYAAETVGSGAVQPGETAQLAYGYVSSLKDAIRMAGKGLAAGDSQFMAQFKTMDWQDQSRLSLLANGAPEMIPDDAPTQAGASFLRAALPTSWIGAADDFAKFINYRAYLRSIAYRDGASQGMDGPDLATHLAATLDNVPQSLHQRALAETLRSTFQDPLTGWLKTMETLVDTADIPLPHTDFKVPLGRIVMPFVKVPANIMRWSYNNTALAPMFPSQAFKEQLAAGGARRDLAMARVWLGSAVALGLSDMALNSAITGAGPRDAQLQRAWRAAGNEPYSIQLPGQRPVSYNMVEPLGMLTGAIADTFNIMKFAREDGRENLAASLMFGVGHAMLSKTYLQGMANLFEAMNDPERDGDRIAQSMALALPPLGLLAPQGVAAVAHALDPFIRAHRTLMDNIESRLPIVSQNLPPARTLWGDPIPQKDAYLPFLPSDSFVPRLISPWQLGPKPDEVEPIDNWIWDNRASFPRAQSNRLGLSKATEFQSFEVSRTPPISVQVQLTAREYDRFQELAGNGLKDPSTGLGAKDLLNGLVTGTSSNRDAQDAWNQQSPAVQAVTVQRVVNRYRAAAREQLLHEFPDLLESVDAGAKTRAAQLRGAQLR